MATSIEMNCSGEDAVIDGITLGENSIEHVSVILSRLTPAVPDPDLALLAFLPSVISSSYFTQI